MNTTLSQSHREHREHREYREKNNKTHLCDLCDSARDPNSFLSHLNSKGVSMVEFALVMPFFILLVFGLIDISRYFAYQAILNKGAENGINLAMKIPNLDVDLTTEQQGSINYLRYQQARDLVLNTASEFPLRTLFSDSNQQDGTLVSLATLESFTYPDNDSNGLAHNYDAALIFPAESIILDSTGGSIEHKTLPSSSPSSAQGKQNLLKQHPVILKLRARIKPISPFVQPITIESTAMGFREEVPRGPLTGEYGLADPSPTSSSSSSSSSSTGSTLEPVPHSNENNNTSSCLPNFNQCAQSNNDKCIDYNSNAAQCFCTQCNSIGDPGWENLAY